MQYMMWRVLTGRHDKITISFLLAGHTKFSPDWCFGLAKQKLRRSIIGCLDDLANAITNSAAPNITELVGLEDGTVLVPMYNWVEFLGLHFRKIPQIKKQHHFIFTTTSRGKVTLKEFNDSEEVKFKMLKDDWSPSATDLPPVVTHSGLPAERQWYLFDSIREYCPETCRDDVCPLPSVPRLRQSAPPSPVMSITDMEPPLLPPPSKRARTCSVCGEVGHNARRHK